MARVSWNELMTAPSTAPEWFQQMVQSIKVADHLGDVWDALTVYAPDAEVKEWVRTVAYATFVNNVAGESIYENRQ